MRFEFEENWALFLDVDGTLAGIEAHPDAVTVERAVLELLDALHGALGGALALVSGRSIDELDALVAPLRLPAAGLHGVERRDARGALHRSAVDEAALARVRDELRRFAEAHPGAWVEDKTSALALHVRQAPLVDAELARFAGSLAERLPDQLVVQRGKRVVEVKPKGENKGTAVAAFMDEAPFKGRRPVFVGDDVTDEDAFAWVNAHEGLSIKVGAGGTLARHHLEDASDVARWLAAYRDFLAEGRHE